MAWHDFPSSSNKIALARCNTMIRAMTTNASKLDALNGKDNRRGSYAYMNRRTHRRQPIKSRVFRDSEYTNVIGLGSSATILVFVLMAVAMFCALRLSVALPAVAIGKPLPFSQAWEATQGKSGPIVFLLVLNFGAQYLVQLLFIQLGFFPLFGHVLNLLVIPMINISILTTMYGVFVEKRELS